MVNHLFHHFLLIYPTPILGEVEVIQYLLDSLPFNTHTTLMAKGRGSKSTKLQAARDGTAKKAESSTKPVENAKVRNISDALRQAVADLGGDDEDLDLIAGIDDSENEEEVETTKKSKKASDDTVDEVCCLHCELRCRTVADL
jgi:hypothetical protein